MTRAVVLCAAKTPGREIAILVNFDGTPQTLGRALANVCTNILFAPTTHPAIAKHDPDLRYRLCMDNGLSAMVIGLLHPLWDEIGEEAFQFGDDEDPATHVRSRYSHNQFELLPVTEIGSIQASFTFQLEFREHPPLPFYSNPKRAWIALHGENGFEGWPEDFIAWLDLNYPEDPA